MYTSDTLADLIAFRDSLYSCFGRRADALFELADAILTAGPRPSPVHLSLEPAHRRGWGGLYAALSRGTVDASALRALLARYPLADEPVRVYGVDCSVWARCDAEASRERGYYYHPPRGYPAPAGPTGGRRNSGSPATRGPRRWMCAACIRTRTLTPSRRNRSEGCSTENSGVTSHRCSCSTRVMIPCN